MGTIQQLQDPLPLHPSLLSPAPTTSIPPPPSTTEYHLTAFSHFHNVPVNPTQLILTSLPTLLTSTPLPTTSHLASTTVLQVAAETSRHHLEKLYTTHCTSRPANRPRPHQTIFIHLGLNAAARKFQLEIQARNEATFSFADQLGHRPVMEPIDKSQPLTSFSRTNLPVHSLLTRIKCRGFDTELSTDAGRFVCNWVYYNSLQMARRSGATALFVHVPPTAIADIALQTRFVKALLEEIATLPW